jgi:hypothetical protein
MMRTIWKYEMVVEGQQVHEMPMGAKVLCVQIQAGKPCIWALVDPERPMKEYMFLTFGTGHEIPDNESLAYIGSYQLYNGAFVGHLFEMGE